MSGYPRSKMKLADSSMMPFFLLHETLSWILPWILSCILSWFLSWFLSRILSWMSPSIYRSFLQIYLYKNMRSSHFHRQAPITHTLAAAPMLSPHQHEGSIGITGRS